MKTTARTIRRATDERAPGARRRLLPGLLPALLLAPLLLPPAAAQPPEPAAPQPTAADLPEPDLSGLEPPVAEQLAEMRAFVVRLLTETETPPQHLAEAIGELGRLYLAYELHGPAEESLRLADRMMPRDFRWTYHLGYLTQTVGRLEEAATFYERALAIVPNVTPAKIRLGRVYADLDRPERAEWVLRDALAADPASAAAEAALGELLVAQGRHLEGEELLRSALERQPGANRLYYPLALALRGRGEEDAARAMMERRGPVGVRPADPLIDGLAELAIGERVHLLRGRAAFQAGQFEEAEKEFRGALEIQPESTSALINLGATLGRLDDVEGAIAMFRRAVEIAPANSTALYNLARLLQFEGRLDEALEHYRNAALYAPEDGGVRIQFAEALRLTGKLEEALIHYRAAAELEPPGELARFREAQVLNQLGRDAQALEVLAEGLRVVPRSSMLALTLARLLASSSTLELRDGRRAVELLESAPIRRTMRAFETLAMAHAEAGDCDQAVEWQSQALEAALDFDDAALAAELERILAHYRDERPCRYPVLSADATADPAPAG